MYKFFGPPNMLVKERKKQFFNSEFQCKPIFRFDANGEYLTNDEKLIIKLKSRFDHMMVVEEQEKPKSEEIQKEEQKEAKTYKCKKCDFETENPGDLMVHYRKEHPKK